ncbi:MAG: Cytochrome c oxidase polypeptide III, partial [uncultured Chloroflexia bacterium]
DGKEPDGDAALPRLRGDVLLRVDPGICLLPRPQRRGTDRRDSAGPGDDGILHDFSARQQCHVLAGGAQHRTAAGAGYTSVVAGYRAPGRDLSYRPGMGISQPVPRERDDRPQPLRLDLLHADRLSWVSCFRRACRDRDSNGPIGDRPLQGAALRRRRDGWSVLAFRRRGVDHHLRADLRVAVLM